MQFGRGEPRQLSHNPTLSAKAGPPFHRLPGAFVPRQFRKFVSREMDRSEVREKVGNGRGEEEGEKRRRGAEAIDATQARTTPANGGDRSIHRSDSCRR